ncbi:replication fork protection component Swi3-domain-containing protein [Xylariales sp. AK1849]|nr:replication fork protection component Swi3-domain-containing protein [Xylariales sp. AK1849]
MAPATENRTFANNDLDDYGVDDFDLDPFAESGDDNANNPNPKKRKDATGLGIEETVTVAKKARVPNVKLDENRLLSEKGIPKLRRKAGELKFKGKGHEFSDTARLLSFYQLWLDDLFPKAKFLDALAMVEKTGHKGRIRMARMEWIDEGRPKSSVNDDDADQDPFQPEGRDAAIFPTRVAPMFQNSARASERPKTPTIDDLFEEDDIYNATPGAGRRATATDAPLAHSLFGNGASGQAHGGPDDDEDLDALMAEEEAQRAAPSISIFGNGEPVQKPAPKPAQHQSNEPDEDDLDALMAEAEADSQPRKTPTAINSHASQPSVDIEEDDLDALMAETETRDAGPKPNPQVASKQSKAPPVRDEGADADEEEVMAEMDGLW